MNKRAAVHFNIQQYFALLTIFLLLGTTFLSSQADTQEPQALQTIDLLVTPANVSILGATDDDHLSGNGTDNVFTPLPRSHALVSGDFNADGIADLALGAPDADYLPPGTGQTNRANTGAVYILFGRQSFTSPTLIDANLAATSQPDVRIFGAANNDNTGFALAVGDINADGVTDLLIGAPGVDFGSPTARTDTGAVFILLGSSTLTPRTIDLAQANAANIAIYGEKAGDGFGSALAVGDVGGSSTTADILIGAPFSKGANDDRTDGGAAYLLYGAAAFTPNPPTQTRVLDLATVAANARIFGAAGSNLGSAVAIGDVTGAAPGELFVGAPHSLRPATVNVNDTGAVFGILGGANLVPATGTTKNFDIAATEQNISIYGTTSGDHVGASIATGDVTGDGVADLIIGAPDADGPAEGRAESGEAYLIAGGTPLTPPSANELRINIQTSTVALTIYGETTNAHLGAYVTTGRLNTIGNQDGTAELIVGSPGALSNRGSISVFFGGSTLTFINIRDVLLGQDDFRVLGQVAGGEFGWSIVATDLDNNRGGDLAAGAPFANITSPTRTEAGRVYVVLASNDVVPPINQAPTVQVTAPNGTESIAGGSTTNITWTASDPNGDNTIQSFEIRLSTDGGATFNTTIVAGLAGTARSFTWNVPNGITTTRARVRVIATDNTNLQGQDDSNANFTITDPGVSVTLTAPNGGERLLFGQTFQITWTVPVAIEAQVRGFDLFYSTDGGMTFNLSIASNPLQPALGAGVRTFNWTVPSACLSAVRVLVVATSINGARSSDASNGNFSIISQGPTIDLNSLFIDLSINRLSFKTTTPAVGNEIPLAEGAVISVSNDEAGTAYSSFTKFKSKRGGTKIITKGSINGQELSVFFPNNATRFLRITNPPCGETLLKVKRMGDQLVIVNPGTVDEPQE